jgi:D-ornithine 4,5-aminomutase subunit alpha
MSMTPRRPDDFEARREPLRALSDAELRERFWVLVDRIVAPLVDEARSHTTPAIERSVLLRMGLGSGESQALVERMAEGGLLGRGAGRLLLELAQQRGMSPREAAQALLDGDHWEALAR